MNSRNLVLIVGNGFDLAHGLKTSYNDFSNYLIKLIADKTFEFRSKEELIEDSFFNDDFIKSIYRFNSQDVTVSNHKFHASTNGFVNYLITRINSKKELFEFLKKNKTILRFVLNNQFLLNLFNNSYDNWFDIENAYFIELRKVLLSSIRVSDKHKLLLKLNFEFNETKVYLIKYLKTIKPKKDGIIEQFLNETINGAYTNVYCVNFNYTGTMKEYMTYDTFYSVSQLGLNNIHGSLDEEKIIFGYGDDQNKDYQKMKDTENDEYLKHFKTFQYLHNSNYSNLYEEWLDSIVDYDVFVLGHSLGTTDKTLLKEIFENPKCNRIHLFKRKDLEANNHRVLEEYNKLLFSLSRIISNDSELRQKTKSFEDSIFFP